MVNDKIRVYRPVLTFNLQGSALQRYAQMVRILNSVGVEVVIREQSDRFALIEELFQEEEMRDLAHQYYTVTLELMEYLRPKRHTYG